jgi:HTH-type transcriptional regulator / antitoxin MqsA
MSNKAQLLCTVCDVGSLTPSVYSDYFSHNSGKIFVEGLEKYDCSECHESPIFTDQVRRNQIRISDAKRLADGLLTCTQVKKIRDRLGLSQSGAASAFGGGGNAFSKYERGEVIQSFAMDRLLRLAADIPEVMARLASYLNEPPTDAHFISNKNSGPLNWQDVGVVLPVPARRIRSA